MKRYCGMCDKMVTGRECQWCGADTDAMPHTCHDMNPPHPYPCSACEVERNAYELERKLTQPGAASPNIKT